MRSKIVVLVMVMALVLGGCAAVNSFLCSPTPQQTEAANVGLALAQAALTAATVYVGGPLVGALSSQAIPVFQKVIAGYCVAQADWDVAVAALQSNQTTKALGDKSAAFEFLASIKWSK